MAAEGNGMVEGTAGRLKYAGKWGAVLLLAVAVLAGLVALPNAAPARATSGGVKTARTLASLPHLSGSFGPSPRAIFTPPSPYAQQIPADAPRLSSSAAYLMDPTTGEVLYANNAATEVAMASTTKIMTAIVAITFGKVDQRITIGADAVKEQNGVNSIADLQKGDVLTLHDLLYALLLPSGDDAAVAIADGVAGSQANFVRMMNLEAALLGLDHTHYANVHGLDAPGHYTTAGDLARLARVAMGFTLFASVVKTPTYVVTTALHGAYTWHTTNELLITHHLYQGAIGVKTGHTGNAGFCLVFAATRNGATLIGVLLGEQDQSGEQRFSDATALLNWGFEREQNVSQWMNAIAGKH